MKKRINHQFFFPHPVEIVWDYLTKPDLIELWLMKNNFQPVTGTEFQFMTGPIPSLNFDGIVYCEVLEVVPLKKLTYTWRSGPGQGQITLDSLVQWKLQEIENGTELLLEHSGFGQKDNLDLYHALLSGWLQNIEKIDKLLKTS